MLQKGNQHVVDR